MNPFSDILNVYAKRNPKGTAVISATSNRAITWRELNDQINRLASGLYDLGLRKGDKGIIMLQNCPEFIVSFFALQKVGALPCPMNCRFVPAEIEFQTNHSESKVFITGAQFAEAVRAAIPAMPGVEHYISVGGGEGFLDYTSLLQRSRPEEPPVDCGLDDESQLAYTGGTTGFPKGVVCTYRQAFSEFEGFLGVLFKYITQTRLPALKLPVPFSSQVGRFIAGDFIARLLQQENTRRTLTDPAFIKKVAEKYVPLMRGMSRFLNFLNIKFFVMAPFFHAGGWGAGPLCAWLQTGAMSILLSETPRFDASETMRIIDRYKPTVLGGVPTMLEKMLALPDRGSFDLGSVSLIGSGAVTVSKDLKQRILKGFPSAIYMEVYGQTELSPWAVTRMESSAQVEKVKDTIGTPFTTLSVRVVDADGEDVPRGEVGELIYQGPSVMKGYYKDPERNAQVLRDGWYYSGDMASFDEEGEIKLVGRKLEMINVGGEKIYPSEVEEILETHPAVEHALLTGIPDEVYVEIPAAVIQLREGRQATEEEIQGFCRDRMSGFKLPRFVLFVDKIPCTDADKVRRKVAEEMYAPDIRQGYETWRSKI